VTRPHGLPMDDDWRNEPRIAGTKVRLRDVLKPRKTIIDYIYDFGGGWQRRLTITDVRAGDRGVCAIWPRRECRYRARRANRYRTSASAANPMNSFVAAGSSQRMTATIPLFGSIQVQLPPAPIAKKLWGDAFA
jgi:hypothetical protein